ncbi:hypothetical protein [Clostridium lundense]|uniref:hypothetical protein n=1 Tax=Clostridium lundense TaxID=319475 RepID=UPI000482034E|nr:hypothetical protein [Clostridium lundense]
MKTIKMILICFFPMPLLYLLNVLIFNKYPVFFPCFLGSCTYIPSITKINSCSKVMDNLLEKHKKELSNEDLMNLLLVFILTCLFIILIHIIERKVFVNANNLELGYPFWGTAIIFQVMGYLKIPKRFF